MGPPPPDVAPDGRYNKRRTSVLYLADSPEGVSLELSTDRLCLQEFQIDPTVLKLADLSSPETPNVLAAAFDVAESSHAPGRRGRPDYAFSQLLGAFVRDAGFDGMIVPGVRGTKDQKYGNVVVFRCESWQSWSLGHAGFRRIGPADT